LGTGSAKADRYVHIGAALSFAVLALAADVIVRRKSLLLLPVAAVFLAGIPGNLQQVHLTGAERYGPGQVEQILTTAHVPALRRAPRDVELLAVFPVTVGWLQDSVAMGKIPEPDRMDPTAVAHATMSLLLDRDAPEAVGSCSMVEAADPQTVRKGQTIVTSGGPVQLRFPDEGDPAMWVRVPTGSRLAARADVVIEVRAVVITSMVDVCG
jgi:hypothetical protein